MKEFKIENHYLVLKEAGFIIFGISSELTQNPENKNLCDAFHTIMNILRKPIIPVLFGSDMKWKEAEIGLALSDTLYVNMQNPKRYDHRINELTELIEHEKSNGDKSKQLRDQPTDVFISYCWVNSHDAVCKGIISFDSFNYIIFLFTRYKINCYFNWLGRSSSCKSKFLLIRFNLSIENIFYLIGLS